MPVVSVVIPAYNAADRLSQAIESALAQTCPDLEIIVIDDGSADDTAKAAKRFGSRVRYLYQQHRGVSAARNLGIRLANGKYVAFLDADDLWRPEKLQRQLPYLENDPRVALVCSDWALETKGAFVPSVLSTRRPVKSGYRFREVVQNVFVLTSTVVARRQCLEDVGCFDENFPTAEDQDLWLRISYHHWIGVVPTPLMIKRQLDNGLSTDARAASIFRIKLLEMALATLPHLSWKNRRILRTALSKNCLDLGYDDFCRMAWKEARGTLLASLTNDWTRFPALAYLMATYLPVPMVNTIRTVKRTFA